MESKLTELTEKLTLIKEENRVKYTELMSQVNNIINKVIIRDSAKLVRSWADTDSNNEIFFRFEIGFHNHTTNNIDWGSEIDFTYESRTGMLSINHGCIGTFNKTNVGQFYRAALISYVFDNIGMIENEFAQLTQIAKAALHTDNEWQLEGEIRDIKINMRKQALKQIENNIMQGCTLAYAEDCQLTCRQRLFHEVVYVQRCTPKYVFVEDKLHSTLKLRKDVLVNQIYSNYIINIER